MEDPRYSDMLKDPSFRDMLQDPSFKDIMESKTQQIKISKEKAAFEVS